LDRRLLAEQVLVGPLRTDDVRLTLRQAEALQESAPAESGSLYGEIADQLAAAGYRGHAASVRERQTTALTAAGQASRAVAMIAGLLVEAVDRGDHDEARRLRYRLGETVEVADTSEGHKFGLGVFHVQSWFELLVTA
jgi:hypothetical protein